MLDEIKHHGELRKDQGAVASLNDLSEEFAQRIQLRCFLDSPLAVIPVEHRVIAYVSELSEHRENMNALAAIVVIGYALFKILDLLTFEKPLVEPPLLVA